MPKAGLVTVTYADGTTTTKDAKDFRKVPYWRTPTWRRKRALALERAGHRCEACKRTTGDDDQRLRAGLTTTLEVHHLTYERYGRERLDDLLVLCQRCHAAEHQWLRRRGRQLTIGGRER